MWQTVSDVHMWQTVSDAALFAVQPRHKRYGCNGHDFLKVCFHHWLEEKRKKKRSVQKQALCIQMLFYRDRKSPDPHFSLVIVDHQFRSTLFSRDRRSSDPCCSQVIVDNLIHVVLT